MMKAWPLLVAGFVALGTPAFAQQSTGDYLISAGFKVVLPDTAAKKKALGSVAPNQFVTRRRAGRVTYVYSDPAGCGCAYVGNQSAMDTYRTVFSGLASTGGWRDGSTPDPEQSIINADETDDAESQINDDIFNPDF